MTNKHRNPRASKSTDVPPITTGHFARNLREIVESIAIAFILAFLFRTFEAEAFVIPTGSMAPTLMGRHKDVECPQCGYRYKASASHEESPQVQALRAQMKTARENVRRGLLRDIRGEDTVAVTCPICRFTMPVSPIDRSSLRDPGEIAEVDPQPSYNGDRILVSKFAYALDEPERWDVIVFKFPGDGNQNYIKRLVGLPGETLRIYQGDLFVKNRQGGRGERDLDTFTMERKPPSKVLALMQTVHDTNHDPSTLRRAGWPLRWSNQPGEATSDESDGTATTTGWQIETNADSQTVLQTYSIGGETGEDKNQVSWLRYQHIVPDMDEWLVIRGESEPVWDDDAAKAIAPWLITDMYAYNTDVHRKRVGMPGVRNRGTLRIGNERLGMHWVSDLLVECDVEVASAKGALLLDLVKGGKHFTCTIELETGEASVRIVDYHDFAASGQTPIRGAGTYHIRFGNVDDQLLLWVDDVLVDLGSEDDSAEYDATTVFGNRRAILPTVDDLAPVGIGARGAKLDIDRLRVLRDIYYIADAHDAPGASNPITDLPRESRGFDELAPNSTYREGIENFLTNPAAWQMLASRRPHEFVLKKNLANPSGDQFFVLGDNSPSSKDARLWRRPENNDVTGVLKQPGGQYVERKLLIGKAMIVFWPHSWDRIPWLGIPLPFVPNFGDMRLIR